jgi:transcriptional regulator with XRE-family HTH domain
MSQRDLARVSGVNKATVSGYERGKLAIGPENLDAMLAALGLSERAWDATIRHVQWLDHLRIHEAGVYGDGSERQVLLLAETIAREIERGVSAVLHELVTPAGSSPGDAHPVDDEEL